MSTDQQRWQVQFIQRNTDGLTQEWWADILEDVSQRKEVVGSCRSTHTTLTQTYQISTLQAIESEGNTVYQGTFASLLTGPQPASETCYQGE